MDAEPITTQKQPCALILINSSISFEGYFDNDIRLLANALQLNKLSIDYSVVVHNIISWYCIVQCSIVYRLLLPLIIIIIIIVIIIIIIHRHSWYCIVSIQIVSTTHYLLLSLSLLLLSLSIVTIIIFCCYYYIL